MSKMTEPFKIDFQALPWESSLPGARFKTFRQDRRQVRLLELTDQFVEPHWCTRDHIGIVLEGELEIDFKGRIVRFGVGDGLFIPGDEASAHKTRSITPTARLMLVEDT